MKCASQMPLSFHQPYCYTSERPDFEHSVQLLPAFSAAVVVVVDLFWTKKKRNKEMAERWRLHIYSAEDCWRDRFCLWPMLKAIRYIRNAPRVFMKRSASIRELPGLLAWTKAKSLAFSRSASAKGWVASARVWPCFEFPFWFWVFTAE